MATELALKVQDFWVQSLVPQKKNIVDFNKAAECALHASNLNNCEIKAA